MTRLTHAGTLLNDVVNFVANDIFNIWFRSVDGDDIITVGELHDYISGGNEEQWSCRRHLGDATFCSSRFFDLI